MLTNLHAGKFLKSSPSMPDANFKASVIFIAEYNTTGAMAFVINQVFERPLNALAEFSSSPAFPLNAGGPVDKEHLFFIHRCNDMITGGTKIINDIYLGGNFKKAIACINNKTLTERSIKIFIGYCGWDAGELEAEIVEGSWEMANDDLSLVFGEDPYTTLPGNN